VRIVFVRHGHPDYKNDCLTELGHLHGEAVAQRLVGEGIEEIYSSTRGRAMQTAEHIASRLGLPILECDFMREIGWGSFDENPIPLNGHPWHVSDDMVSKGESVTGENWANEMPFRENRVVGFVQKVAENLDIWLEGFGCKREGLYYRVTGQCEKTVAMVSHAGSSSAAFSHLFNIAFPFFCQSVNADFTAVTVVTISGKAGELVSPRFEIVNDARHIAGLDAEKVYGA